MKALLLLIFIPAIMQGQKKDSFQIKGVLKDSTISKVDTIDVLKWAILDGATATNTGTTIWTDITTATRGYNFTITPKNDTVGVIIFYADTTYLKSLDNYVVYRGVWKDSSVSIGDVKHRVPYVLWTFGYIVIYYYISFDGLRLKYMSNYLDEKKMPLPKSIVVFQTIKL